MKTRLGFVSNSSSASFVAPVDRLTPDQVEKLLSYTTNESNTDHWDIALIGDLGDTIFGWTACDNSVIDEYLKECGIDQNLFHWEDLS